MVVAARAAERQAEERRPRRIHGIGLPLGPELVAEECILGRQRADGVETGADALREVDLLLLREIVAAVELEIVGP